MSAATVQLESAPRHRWLIWAAVILTAQTGFIFWLGAHQPITPRKPNVTPPIALAPEYDAELAALSDPTLFALPHWQGFSGTAWKQTPRVGYTAADWSEPMRWLQIPAEKLGSSFRQILADNPTPPLSLTEKTAPRIAALGFATDFFPLPAQSALRMEGALAGRTLRAPLELKSWPAADVLASSEVLVLVDAAGNVVSTVLLTGCGLPAADQQAVEQASAARFEPLPDGDHDRLAHPLANLARGKMIFQWHTMPPLTETPATNP